MYVDSKYKTNESVNNNDLKFEIKEALALPGDTVCYIDDILIPHTRFTIEENLNNTSYVATTKINTCGPTWYHTLTLEMPSGRYTGSSLALALQNELQYAEPGFQFVCNYHPSTSNITVLNQNVSLFIILTDLQAMTTTI